MEGKCPSTLALFFMMYVIGFSYQKGDFNMAMEIERKFLVKGPLLSRPDKIKEIKQHYLRKEEGFEERVRETTDMLSEYLTTKYTHTIKKGTGISRKEEEEEITFTEFDNLCKGEILGSIIKTRYCVDRWELDIYPVPDDIVPIKVMEIELVSEDEKLPALPEGITIIKEVTEDKNWKNANIAIKGFPLS